MYEFLDFLPTNKCLLSLSISNNQLDAKIGEILKDKMQENTTLIDMDFSMNNFSMADSQEL